ncbi:MAG: transcription-repair coupling factor [Planctomycetota bacterium]
MTTHAAATHLAPNLSTLRASTALRQIADALASGDATVVHGSVGSSTVTLASLLAHSLGRPVVLVMAHLDEAVTAVDELAALGTEAIHLPALEVLPGETDVAADLLAERVAAARAIGSIRAGSAPVIIATIHALMQSVPKPSQLESLLRRFAPGDRQTPEALVDWLAQSGYERRQAIEAPGEFAIRGGILDVFPAGTPDAPPVRFDFFGDEIERITEIDLQTMGSDRRLEAAELVAAPDHQTAPADGVNALTLMPDSAVALLAETVEVTEQGRGYFERLTDSRGVFGPPAVFKLLRERFAGFAEINQFSTPHPAQHHVDWPVGPLPAFSEDSAEAVGEVASLLATTDAVVITCENQGELDRCTELFADHGSAEGLQIVLGAVHRGYLFRQDEGPSLALVPYHELLHRFQVRRRSRRLRAGRAMDTFLELEPGDYVVHADHGIAQFTGLRLMPANTGKPQPTRPTRASSRNRSRADASVEQLDPMDLEEYLTLEFAGGSQLHVSALKIDHVQKYIGGFAGKPPLSKLGGKKWARQKEQASESVRDLAAELLRVRAARESMPGIRYPDDTTWQREFEAEFPYQETDDQLAGLAAIKKDMTSERPMDRLVCGDVGFGKTELAIRAAFKACEFGKQVAVLVPTTVLAEQHERTFRSRFADYPFRVESLSRFKTTKETNAVLAALRRGQIDIVIGTHRLLSKDVRFNDLGLVVVDEEQRFGVEHKERLLQLRMTADVLTLSATPIPRTLHMSMLGIRDISSLATAPADRQSIVTEVIPYNAKRLKQAIARELSREGQIYWVHNRVHDIHSVADKVRDLAPDAEVVVGHGQMTPQELEAVMLRFIRGQADILVSTTIIESGLDIPRANTMIIDDADRFGLAELHQLRGRVGRSRHRAYCYLLLPENRVLTPVAQKRLKALEQYSMLGAGFKIAMRDLEIRGAGNILGPEQSGHIASIGYELYCRLLEDAVRDLTHAPPPSSASRTNLEIGLGGSIPRAYIPAETRRLEVYRRIASADGPSALAKLREDLESAYGKPPPAVERLLELAEIRIAASALGVRAVVRRESDLIFRAVQPRDITHALQGSAGTVSALPPKSNEQVSEVYCRLPDTYFEPTSLLAFLRSQLSTSDDDDRTP